MGRLDGPRPRRTGDPSEETTVQTYWEATTGGTAVCRPGSSGPHLTVGSSSPGERAPAGEAAPAAEPVPVARAGRGPAGRLSDGVALNTDRGFREAFCLTPPSRPSRGPLCARHSARRLPGDPASCRRPGSQCWGHSSVLRALPSLWRLMSTNP